MPKTANPVRKTDDQPLKSLFRKWEIFSKNIKQYPAKAPILLPDLFVVYESGTDIKKLIASINEFLRNKQNLMEFYGDVFSVDFLLNYCSPSHDFNEILRFMNEIKSAAGFRNHFKGVVRIDITNWLGHHEEQYFNEFLSYLSDNARNWLIVLTTAGEPKRRQDIELMSGVVSMFLRIESIQIKLPGAEYYLEHAETQLADYGVTLTDEAREMMLESIKVIRKNRYFSGEYNINCLADDIIYTLYSRSGRPAKTLTPADLEAFGPESEYIKRTIVRMEKKNSIGFGN